MSILVLHRTTISMAGVAAVAAIALGGCGGASGSGSGPRVTRPSAEIARAADISGASKGYVLRMSMRESVPGVGTVKVGATGTFSTVSHSGTMTMNIQAAGQRVKTRSIVLGSSVYTKEPPSIAAKLPGAKPWLKLDLSKVGKQSYLSNVASLNSTSWTNPAAAFTYLKADSTHIQELGHATVDGIPTTHFHATLNLTKVGTGLPASTHAELQGLLRKLPAKILNKTDVPVDVWIDGSQLIRKQTVAMKLVPKGTSETIGAKMTTLITSYGPQPTPKPPPASQTLDLLALLRAEGKAGALSAG